MREVGPFLTYYNLMIYAGNACKTWVIGRLIQEFSSPAEAERYYFAPTTS